jgi:signal transduction histidine kinase
VLENLCNNAIKYGAPEKKVTVSLDRVENGIRFMVHNEGDAISLENQAKLFEPYERAQKHLGTGGWGLGLTLVRGIVEAHNGKVWVKSTPAHGTLFIVEIPQ